MPHIVVKLVAGKSEEQKNRLAEAITRDVVDVFSIDEASVSVAFEEVHREDWLEGVYRPEIQGKWETLYKKPGYNMAEWPKPELHKIAEADDLHIAPFREDGKTYGTPTWIWSVAVDDGLYARGYHGQKSRWYQAAVRQGAGRIIAAGMTKEVSFERVEGELNDRIDDAYRAKYRGSPYVDPMTGARARAATVRITPRPVEG